MKGQVFIELLLGAALMLLIGIIGISLLLKGLGILIVTRASAENSRCLAKHRNVEVNLCAQEVTYDLSHYFAIRHVAIHSRILRGVIHSSVDGEYKNLVHLRGDYDLGPGEYLRRGP